MLAVLAFWVPLACVVYTYLGYPLLLLLIAVLRPARVGSPVESQPAVSVVVVACNEAATIARKLDSLLAQDYPGHRLEIIVASDGSTDATAEIVRAYAAHRVCLMELPGPNGKPVALNAAVQRATGDVLVLCDARQPFEPEAVGRLVRALGDPTVGAASGELVLAGGSGSGASEGVGIYWRFEKLLRRLEARVDSSIGATGAIYALRRDLYRPIPAATVLDDVLIPMEVTRQGQRVVFEAGARAHDQPASSAGHEYRRKVRTLAGNFQLLQLRPWLLDPRRNRLLWQFVSHKIARLLVPWWLLVVAIATVPLSFGGSVNVWLYRAAGAAQVGFYALALAGFLGERTGRRTRAFAAPWAFTLLNVAAAHAFFVFAAGRARANWRTAA